MDTSNKIKSCFQKLFQVISRSHVTLWKVFNDFDQKKGSIDFKDFTLLLTKLGTGEVNFSEEELRSAFNIIDEDGSNTIEF